MFCYVCGTKLIENAPFCPECGSRAQVSGAAAPSDGDQTAVVEQPLDTEQPRYTEQAPYTEQPPAWELPYRTRQTYGGQPPHGNQPDYGGAQRAYGASPPGTPPPVKPGGSKKLAKILIPAGVVVIAAIVITALWLTGVFSFGQGGDSIAGVSPPPDTIEDVKDTPSMPSPQPATVSPAVPAPDPSSPVTPSAPDGGLSGSGGKVFVSGTTDYEFTPDRSGVWEFVTSNNDGDPYLWIYDSRDNLIAQDDDNAGGGNALITIRLEAGNTYVVTAGFYGESTGSYTLTVSGAASIAGGGGEARVNGSAVYEFTPIESGIWEIYTSNNGDSDPYLTIYDSSGDCIAEDDDGSGGLNAYIALFLEAGQMYSISAGCYSDSSGSYTLTVSQVEPIPGEGGDIPVSGAKGFAFTPEYTGIWEIRTSSDGRADPYVAIYDSYGSRIAMDDDSAGDYDAVINVLLSKEMTYTVKVSFYGGGSCTLSITLETGISAVASGSTLPGSGGSFLANAPAEFMFSPEQSGVWVFYTSDNNGCDPYLQLFDSRGDLIGYDDDGAGDANALIVLLLDSDEIYTISAECYADSQGVYLLNIITPTEIPSSGGDIPVVRSSVFSFVPNRSGTWEFRTSDNGGSDPYLVLYDANGNILDYDDDSAGDLNAIVGLSLNAGEVYGIYAGFYGSGSGSYTLSVTRG